MTKDNGKLAVSLGLYAVFSLALPYLNGSVAGSLAEAFGVGKGAAAAAAMALEQIVLAGICLFLLRGRLRSRVVEREEKDVIGRLNGRRVFMFVILMCYAGALFAHNLAGFFGTQDMRDFQSYPVLFLVYAIVVTPLSEELLFRGLLYDAFRSRMAPALAGLISAALFAAAHTDPAQMAVAAVLGLLLAFVYEVFWDLRAVVLIHAVHNALAMLYPKALVLTGAGLPMRLFLLVLEAACAVYLAVRIYRIRRIGV